MRARFGRRLKGRPVFGDPLDFEAMRCAPLNESGVVLLFGMMAEKLGFIVESLRSAFPDCEAKRRVGGKVEGEGGKWNGVERVGEAKSDNEEIWEKVRIEFEFESRNFRDHGHDAEGCDLIVCWNHNWPECPLEVISLREEIERCRK